MLISKELQLAQHADESRHRMDYGSKFSMLKRAIVVSKAVYKCVRQPKRYIMR
ncbi:hypothetical protein SAMN06265337_0957 [Hymenobacter gelipurpurascens]|uniref:Uncharacterized protein n=1 Tax=Hymenobacter gelipurpurascens TaxID=89968 RepID=A0A212TDB4_9BACT|nr:hypothetical protein SAMN06265337_0957 [Hymenobacter gelipurpurascens]